MDFYNYIPEYTILKVLCGVGIFGFSAGQIGVFAFLRSESLLGDAISHAALPGIALAFLCTYSANPGVLFAGGVCAGFLGVYFLHMAHTYTALKKDAILGIILSVFFGVGLVLLTVIQKIPNANQAIINKFLFGNAATLLSQELYAIIIVSTVVTTVLFIFHRLFSLVTFDIGFAKSLGYATNKIVMVLLLLHVITIVIGLQSVGVVLMSSMLIAPAAAARQWVDRVSHLLILSGFFGFLTCVAGTLMSGYATKMPTGPVIVVISSILVLFSLLCAPKRGLLWSRGNR